MSPNADLVNGNLVDIIAVGLLQAGDGLDSLPALIVQLHETGAWRRFQPKVGPVVEHTDFREFVTAKGLRGLGTTVDMLQRIVARDPDAVVAMRKLIRSREGRGRVPGSTAEKHPCIAQVQGRRGPGYNAGTVAVRLERERPDLFERVRAGEISVTGAQVAAGWRSGQVTVANDNAKSAARSIRRKCSPEFIADLVAELSKSD